MDSFWNLAVSKFEDYLENTNKLISIYNSKGEKQKSNTLRFKVKNYKKWIQEVKKIRDDKIEINNINDLKNLGLKGKIITKLEEIFNHQEIKDNLKLLDIIREFSDPKLDIETEEISKLTSIHDVGYSTAKKLYAKGLTLEKILDEWNSLISQNESYSDLNFMSGPLHQRVSREKMKELSRIYKTNKDRILYKFSNTQWLKNLTYYQLIAVKYYHDIKQRIDRKEIDIFNNVIQKIVKMINKDLIVVICGSYRRECSNSGDIDILLTDPTIKIKEDVQRLRFNYLSELVRVLNHMGIICDHLSEGEFKYMGMCKIDGAKFKSPYARRLDIKFVYYNSFIPELLHFTGSGDLNKQMRTKAIKMNMFLSETGLYTNSSKNKEIVCYTEEEIFKHLKIKYLEPKDRHIDNYQDL